MDNKEILEETLQNCSITAPSEIIALVVNDYLGGEIAKTMLKVGGTFVPYYFNLIENEKIDLNKRLPEYVGVSSLVARYHILKNPLTAKRYQDIRDKIDPLLPSGGF